MLLPLSATHGHFNNNLSYQICLKSPYSQREYFFPLVFSLVSYIISIITDFINILILIQIFCHSHAPLCWWVYITSLKLIKCRGGLIIFFTLIFFSQICSFFFFFLVVAEGLTALLKLEFWIQIRGFFPFSSLTTFLLLQSQVLLTTLKPTAAVNQAMVESMLILQKGSVLKHNVLASQLSQGTLACTFES